MSWILIFVLCLAYIFGGIGYVLTIKRNYDNIFKNKIDKLILFVLFVIWPIWLIILGFAYTMTELEFWIKRKLHYNYYG